MDKIIATLVIMLLAVGLGRASSSEEEVYFFAQLKKAGNVSAKSYSIHLAGNPIYNGVTIQDTPGDLSVSSFAPFSRSLVPGVRYPLKISADSDLDIAIAISLPEGFTAEIDGVLGNAFHLKGGSTGIDVTKEVVIRDQSVLEGQVPTPVGVASEVQIDDLSMKIGLGKLGSGLPAGFIQYQAKDISADTFSRKSLSLLLGAGGNGITVGYEDPGNDGVKEVPRYVRTPSIFADMVDVAGPPAGFDIIFYSDSVPDGNGGYVPAPEAAVLCKYTFRQTAATTLTISQMENTAGGWVTRKTNVVSTVTDEEGNVDRTLNVTGGGLSTTTSADARKEGNRTIVTRSTSYSSAPADLPAAANQTFRVQEETTLMSGFDQFQPMEKLTKRTFNPGDGPNERSEQFRYWLDPENSGSFGQLRAKQNTFGEWSYYLYEDLLENEYNLSLEKLAQWASSHDGIHLAYALMPFHRRLSLSFAPFGNAFDFNMDADYDMVADGHDTLAMEYVPALTWNEAAPRDSRWRTMLVSPAGTWLDVRDQELKPIALPTYFTLNKGAAPDVFRDFICVIRKFYFSDNHDLYDGIDTESYDFEAAFVPHMLDAVFDHRKAFKPAYRLSPDGRKTVFGYAEVNGYEGNPDAAWAEIDVSGTGASRKAFSYLLNLTINGSATYDDIPQEHALRFIEFMDDPKSMRRKAYFGKDAAPGGTSSGPYEHLWTATSIRHNGVDFRNMDAITLVNGKSEKNLRIFNSSGDLVRIERHVLDKKGTWRLIERERMTYDGFGRLLTTFLSRDGATTERKIFECAYQGLQRDYETNGAGHLIDYSYDGLGRLNGRSISSNNGPAGLPAPLRTTMVHDALGRVVEEVEYDGNKEGLVQTVIYDAQGLALSLIDQNRLTTTLSYSKAADAGRSITATYPDSSTYTQVYSKDGRIKRESGTTVATRYYSYSYDRKEGGNGTGHLTARVDEGTTDPDTPHPFVEETRDLSDRIIRQTTSTADGPVFSKRFNYHPKKNRLDSMQETTASQDGGAVSPSISRLYEYDNFGELVRVKTTTDGNASSGNLSSDRVSEGSSFTGNPAVTGTGVASLLSNANYLERAISFLPSGAYRFARSSSALSADWDRMNSTPPTDSFSPKR